MALESEIACPERSPTFAVASALSFDWVFEESRVVSPLPRLSEHTIRCSGGHCDRGLTVIQVEAGCVQGHIVRTAVSPGGMNPN